MFLLGAAFRRQSFLQTGHSCEGFEPFRLARTIGQADWKMQNGEITGTAKPGGKGGWLLLDHSYQDVGFNALFRCAPGSRTGVLFRAEKTPQGMKGIFVSLAADDVTAYRVTLDSEGQGTSRARSSGLAADRCESHLRPIRVQRAGAAEVAAEAAEPRAARHCRSRGP